MPPKISAQAQEWNPEASVSFWINQTSRTILRLHEARLRPLGLSMGQMPVLVALEERGPLPQKELATLARVEQPTMAELLGRMERDGLVRREPNPEDKRGSLTSLTRAGRARLTEAKAALIENERRATVGLAKKEMAALRELLQRVHGNLTDQPDQPDASEPTLAPRRRAT